jgi:acetyl-CoA carboxylase carboxyltransferase component
MSWREAMDEKARREALAYRMGGPEKVKRQHDAGRLTVRERIDALLDPGSFREFGTIAGRAEYDDEGAITEFLPANFVYGHGKIEGRPVAVGADDFTVRGGAADASIRGKQVDSERLAHGMRMPLVRLIEGTGGGGSVRTLEVEGHTYVPANPAWDYVVENLANVPVVGLALGPTAGLGAARAVTSHYSLMVKGQSQLFVAGPPVVARVGETPDKEELGGSQIHTRNGAIDDEVASEQEAFERTRAFLSYLPSSIDEVPPRGPTGDATTRKEDWLIEAVPTDRRKVYKIRPIVEAVVDTGSFFEIGRHWGRSVCTGLARLDGWPVALIASDPFHYGGAWTADASHKLIRFVELAETFHLPVVHLVDIPGFVIGTEGEKAATIRHGARALATLYQATVPWCSVILRKAFGVAGAGHRHHTRYSFRYAWPSGDWGSLPVEGGIEAAWKADLEKADDPEAMLAEIEHRLNLVRNPFRTAERYGVEEIIDPRETRPLLCEFAGLAQRLLRPGMAVFRTRC